MKLLHCAAFLATLALSGVAPASAQGDEDYRASELIHSDLPLFGSETENMWPQPFSNEESFGCVSRVEFGDWAVHESSAEPRDYWYRIWNYGAFHCWAHVAEAYERERLEQADFEPSFFVLLGTSDGAELWALQIGARPGSDYLLLARAPSDGSVTSFDVLQRQCPRANVRDSGGIDILSTRYCSINTRAALLRLARRMAQLPPLGTLTLVESDDPEFDELAE